MPFAPTKGDRKMYILDECHQITGPAQEALLKMLEHPPGHVYFALCTTQSESLKDTLIRRTHQYMVKQLPRTHIVKLLQGVCKNEGLEDFPEPVLRKIAGVCWGSPGQALKMLDQVIDIEDEKMAIEAVEEVTISEETVKDICTTLVNVNLSPKNKWSELRKILTTFNGNAEQARRAILGYMSVVLLNKSDPQIAKMMSLFTDSYIYLGKPGLVLNCYYATGAQAHQDESDIPF
jgi:DNA polymerase III gamma/tau subunit